MIAKYNVACELYNENKFEEAYDIFFTLAKNGDCESQKTIANMLLYGQGIKMDEDSAYTWYKKAADSGDKVSQHLISGCYIHGMYGFEVNFLECILPSVIIFEGKIKLGTPASNKDP